jgi:hypothetical protein
MLRRCLIGVLCLVLSTGAAAMDPILLLVLRLIRDQVIAASIEKGVGAMLQDSAPKAPTFGYALATPPVLSGTEEERIRTIIDESFLHLSASQRDAVFAGMQKILSDPQHAQNKPFIVAEFTLKARSVRDSYRSLDRLSSAEKRALAAQAKEEFRRLPPNERQGMLEVLQSGMLPLPRDLNAIMLSELNTIPLVTDSSRRLD